MDAYYSGREVLPALQLRALPSPAYRGYFSLRPTGTAFQFQIVDGSIPPDERLSRPAGTVICTRLYIPLEEGNGSAEPFIRILRLKLQIPAQNLTLPQSGCYYVYLKLRVQKGSDNTVGHWVDPVQGDSCFTAEFAVSAVRLDPGAGQNHGGSCNLLIGMVSSDSHGALTLVQQLHGEPDIVIAVGEPGGTGSFSSESESVSGSGSASESIVDPGTGGSASASESIVDPGTGESGSAMESGTSESSDGSGSAADPGSGSSAGGSCSDVYSSGSGDYSDSGSGDHGGGGGSTSRSYSASAELSSTSETCGIDGLFYVIEKVIFDGPGGGSGGAAQIGTLGTFIIQAPYERFHHIYNNGEYLYTICYENLHPGVGYETYAEAEEQMTE